ncbi:MAG: sigma-54 dependent transcriptional regulator [Desulfatibacillaceae bacterium]|nr:sigma-54 dependent transcriptional regulator [Desulfatibacillaceae bacterium]
MGRILIVDDDPQLRASFAKILVQEGHQADSAATGEAGVEAVKNTPFDCVVMDVRMPGMDGLTAYQLMKKARPTLPVIIMTAFGTTDTAIEATKMGAFDYVTKPFDVPAVLELINQALKAGAFMQSPVALGKTPQVQTQDALIGASPAMQEVYKAIGRVAGTDATVLIRGESGTGKELVARAVYQHSARADSPFLVINCVAIPETLLESELFGYEKGAFTGAASRRVGKIERANHGSVFLDEIGDMPFAIQSKILRLLQEKSIERLGGREPIPVDVRIIAATNRDLEKAVSQGRFREDLYYRLNVVTLNLPPLRERPADLPLLADYFLARFGREMQMPNPGLTTRARKALGSFAWPGNVRELANTLQKALIFSRGLAIDENAIAKACGQDEAPAQGGDEAADQGVDAAVRAFVRSRLAEGPNPNLFDEINDHLCALILQEALNVTAGNRTQAAKLLGMSRPTLLAKIEKYGLKLEVSAHVK